MIYFVSAQKKLFDSDIIKDSCIEEGIKYCSKLDSIGVDTETTGFQPHGDRILLIQIGDNKNQWVIEGTDSNLAKLKPLLLSKELILQNAKFDLRFLYKVGIFPNKIYDTYLAESVLYMGYQKGSIRKDLKTLGKKYCDADLDKSVRGKIHKVGFTEEVIAYSANDVAYLHEIKEKQLQLIREKDLEVALRLENAFVQALAYVEFCGIYLNKQMWLDKMLEDKKEAIEKESLLNKWILDNEFVEFIDPQLDLFSTERTVNLNWNSEKQLIPLFKKLKVDLLVKDKKTGKLKESIEAKQIQPQAYKSTLIPLYLEYKKAEKNLSTYGENWIKQINKITGRIHTNFSPLMDTGRLSCGGKDKSKHIEYVNIQNLPADNRTRSCFTVQDSNNILIDADYSGQEAVIFANKCLDKNLLDFYDNGYGDQHSYVAKLCFPKELENIPLEEVKKKRPDLRQKAKSAGFALQFGGVGATIASNLGIPLEEGNEVEGAYYNAFPGVKDYFQKVIEETMQNGYILFNDFTKRKSFIDFFDEFKELEKKFTRSYWDKYKEEKRKDSTKFHSELLPEVREFFRLRGVIERKSKNYPVQGSAGDCTKLATFLLFDKLRKKDLLNIVKIVNIVHDELLIEAPENMGEEIGKLTQQCMEKAGGYFCQRVPLKAEPALAKYWKH